MNLHTFFSSVICLLAVASCSGSSYAQQVAERPIPAEEKQRIAKVALQALNEKDISLSQYQDTIAAIHSFPCRGIERALNEPHRLELAKIIASQKKVESVTVLQSFRFGKWHIIYVGDGMSDEHYLFYPDDPAVAKSVAAWGGAATIFETAEIKRWASHNIPGIPQPLASCFAWHVTLSRD